MKQILDLVAPQRRLILHFTLTREIADDKDRLVRDFRLLDTKFEELFLGRVHPMEADEFFGFALCHFGFICRAIPGKTENVIAFVNFIGKPLL